MDGECGGHDSLTVGGDAVEAGSGDFGHESVAAEFDDEPGDSLASSMGLVSVMGWSAVEAGDQVGVSEPVHGVLAGQGGP